MFYLVGVVATRRCCGSFTGLQRDGRRRGSYLQVCTTVFSVRAVCLCCYLLAVVQRASRFLNVSLSFK